jgi:hypothetical protein
MLLTPGRVRRIEALLDQPRTPDREIPLYEFA